MYRVIARWIIISLLVCFAFTTAAQAGHRIVINKSTNKLQLYENNALIKTFPVATGRKPSLTPEGKFSIVNKLINPYYGKLKIPGGDPRNPLGFRWLGLSIGGGGEYGIHGTNNPSSIGKYASSGCIRMYNQDVQWLFNRVPVGTTVEICSIPEKQPKPPKKEPADAVEIYIDPSLPERVITALKSGMIVPPLGGP